MADQMMTVADIQQLVIDCFMANGCDIDNAAALARTISFAERDGSASHGLFRLPGSFTRFVCHFGAQTTIETSLRF